MCFTASTFSNGKLTGSAIGASQFWRAKHSGRQFISDRQRFTAGILRPYEYIFKTQMHPVRSIK
ncbi:hypothetical protein [Microcoleus sp. herbarium12]|uniref:hypothetical protein n=1 Tax=Microcoleus sp. herbarium12 TaxID=3055437 RepID=UPI002FD335A3